MSSNAESAGHSRREGGPQALRPTSRVRNRDRNAKRVASQYVARVTQRGHRRRCVADELADAVARRRRASERPIPRRLNAPNAPFLRPRPFAVAFDTVDTLSYSCVGQRKGAVSWLADLESGRRGSPQFPWRQLKNEMIGARSMTSATTRVARPHARPSPRSDAAARQRSEDECARKQLMWVEARGRGVREM